MNLHFDKWQHIALIGSYCPIQTSVRYCIKSVTLHPNGKGTADGAIRSLKSIFPIRQAEDYCVLKDTARYVLSCSKYFEQLKTPCPCRRLSFPPKSENPPNLRCCFYDLDGAVLFLNHSLSTSVSLYFCFGYFGCSGYCSSIAPSSNAGRKHFSRNDVRCLSLILVMISFIVI